MLNDLIIIWNQVAHNDYRLFHNSPPLAHNPDLSEIALSWAFKLAKKDDLDHSDSHYKEEVLGENLAMWFEKGADRLTGIIDLANLRTIKDIIFFKKGGLCTEMWYEEIENFNWKKPEFSKKKFFNKHFLFILRIFLCN